MANAEISIDEWPELNDGYVELARFWVSQERAVTLLAPDVTDSPALLGSLLVECAHTAADAYAQLNNVDREQALAELWKGFDEERERLKNVD